MATIDYSISKSPITIEGITSLESFPPQCQIDFFTWVYWEGHTFDVEIIPVDDRNHIKVYITLNIHEPGPMKGILLSGTGLLGMLPPASYLVEFWYRQKTPQETEEYSLVTSIVLNALGEKNEMERFDRVKQILDESIGGSDESIDFHGAFWRVITKEEFIDKDVYGKPLITVGDGSASNLIKSLKGEAPFGSDIGTANATDKRMPSGLDKVSDEDIDFLSKWIDDGCP